MRFIRNMIDRRQVWAGLGDYPVYSPPSQYTWSIPTRDEMTANFNHFLETKADRLKYLAEYLASFSVELRLEPAALPALDCWLYRYGGHLIPKYFMQVVPALFRYQPAWAEEYHGLNIINDVAIYAGDYIVSRTAGASWKMWYGDRADEDAAEKLGFGQPCILGTSYPLYRGPHSVLEDVYSYCAAGRSRLNHGSPTPGERWDNPGEFERVLGDLSGADARPG
jgi:hypothetical protein